MNWKSASPSTPPLPWRLAPPHQEQAKRDATQNTTHRIVIPHSERTDHLEAQVGSTMKLATTSGKKVGDILRQKRREDHSIQHTLRWLRQSLHRWDTTWTSRALQRSSASCQEERLRRSIQHPRPSQKESRVSIIKQIFSPQVTFEIMVTRN